MAEDYSSKPITPDMAAAEAVLGQRCEPAAQCRQGGLDVAVFQQDGMVWVVLQRGPEGGLALRMPVFSPDARCRSVACEGALAAVECSGSLGRARLVLRGDAFGLEQLRATLDFTPAQELSFAELPRDLVPFGAAGDPHRVRVSVEAKQRKMNTALLYFTLEQPEFGKVLYLQNLTALNAYFNMTGAKPENAVGGDWGELGYAPPRNPDTGKAVLQAGKTVTLYDTIVAVRRYPRHA